MQVMVPFSLERAARMAAKTAPAGGEEKTRPQTAAVKRPCPTKPTQNVIKNKNREQRVAFP
jgi:hypothetical protein